MLQVIQTPAELEALREEWNALWLTDSRATPFQSPEWLLPWTRHLFGGGRIWTVAERREGKLVSLLPLFRWGAELDQLSFLGAGVSDYLDNIGEPAREIQGDWKYGNLDELREDSPLLQLGHAEACSCCPVLTLPDSYDKLVAGLEPKFRTDLRRNANRLRQAGEVEIRRATNLDALFRLHSARWQSQDESGVLATAALQSFHREVAAGFDARGMLRLYELSLSGETVAVIYAFAHRRRWYGYLNGFDPRFSKLSPGSTLLSYVLEQAIQESAESFDFLRGEEGYKFAWGAQRRTNYRVLLEPMQATGRSSPD